MSLPLLQTAAINGSFEAREALGYGYAVGEMRLRLSSEPRSVSYASGLRQAFEPALGR